MKNFAFLLSVFLMISSAAIGKPDRNTIRFRLSDGSLIKLAINNRYYEATGRVLTVGDIRGSRPYVKVYRFRPAADRRGGRAELLFSGKLKLKPGDYFDAVVDVRTGALSLTVLNALPDHSAAPVFSPGQDKVVAPGPQETGNTHRSPALQQLKENMAAANRDSEKLELALAYLRHSLTSLEAKEIASWFYFDETRLEFARAAQSKVTDEEHFSILRDTFTRAEARSRFDQLLAP